jgi:hypothetical protein
VPEARFHAACRQLSFRRRSWLAGAALGALLVGFVLATRAAESTACCALGGVAVLCAAVTVLGFKSGKPVPAWISIDRNGRFVASLDGAEQQLEPEWLSQSIAVFGAGRRRLVIWCDQIDPTAWRRLRGFARWQLLPPGSLPEDHLQQLPELPGRTPVSNLGARAGAIGDRDE